MISIARSDPNAPGAVALLRQSHALMQELFPPEDNFFLDIGALCAPHIAFFTATDNSGNTEILGTAALADMKTYGELKSMFVSPKARGRGVGARLLERIEQEALARKLPVLRLETGNSLHAARRLYAKAGFALRPPFGDYPEAPSSLFMEKRLT